MSANKASMHFLLLLLISLTTLSSSFSSAEYDSVYAVLTDYGLPEGIFPEGITKKDFTFDPTSGKLDISLSFLKDHQLCNVTKTPMFDPIPGFIKIEFQPKISAIVKLQLLDDIVGLTATVKIGSKVEFADLKIVEAQVQGSENSKTLTFISEFPNIQSPVFSTDLSAVPKTCDADLTVLPIKKMSWFGGIVEIGNQVDDVINNPLFFYKGAFPRRV